MIVRLVEPTDYDDWLAMRSSLWPDCDLLRHKREMERYATRGGSYATFVGDEAGKPLCGFLEASLRLEADGCDGSPVGYVEGLYVRPAFRHQGVARKLIESARLWTVEKGCTEMASDCYVDNEESREVHQKLGFVAVETLIHFSKKL
jgi:aminoglycoside 6'-N-acetyltransferase I